MSSGFSGDFYGAAGGINTGRSTMMPLNNNNNLRPQVQVQQVPYSSQVSGILPDLGNTQIIQGRPNLMGKRSLAEFQQQQQFQFLQQQQQQRRQQQQQMLLQQQQQQGGVGFYLRNVKPRNFQQQGLSSSPISPLSPGDFSSSSVTASSILSDFSSNSNTSTRHSLPVLQQLRSQPTTANITGFLTPNYSMGVSSLNPVQNRAAMPQELLTQESDKKMLNQLQELEKRLLDDDDDNDEEGDTVSVVTNNEWSETIQNLISPCNQNQIQNQNHNLKLASLSPSSSTSSCASSTESPPISCPKQSITEAATAISDGKNDVAVEILTRLSQVSNIRGSSDQRLTAYMVSALRSRVNPTEYPPPVMELHSREHTDSTQNLYEVSPCFKLGFMAANLAILEAVTDHNKLHVIDFDIGQGGQYLHLLHALAAGKKSDNKPPPILKITALTDQVTGVDNRLNSIGIELKAVANKIGVCLFFNVMSCKITELSLDKLGIEADDALAVNFAFKLYRLPDESVTTENLRDELLRRVKGLSPKVVTMVEQEFNGNTAPFLARVNEACGYYGALFDSLDATVSRDNNERVKIESGLSRKMSNSVACEGRDRVERCEVYGKWRARMSMAGFVPRPMSQLVANSLRSKLNSGTRGNPGFTVNEQNGGICFGWMGRTLTVASAWR